MEVACVILNVCIICIVDFTEAFNKPGNTRVRRGHNHRHSATLTFPSCYANQQHHPRCLFCHLTTGAITVTFLSCCTTTIIIFVIILNDHHAL